MSLNLASDPFVNRRPVRRVGAILWVAGLLLAVANVYLYWNHFSGQGAAESGLEEVIGEIEAETERFEAAQAELASFEPRELNRKIQFVNLRIAQRTFSWSRLFDLVTETLPGDVRLSSLTPRFGTARGRSSQELGPEEVLLEIQGAAKTNEALLEFVDRLFAHEAFDRPDLHQEQVRKETGYLDFSISTVYRARAAETDASVEASEQAAEEPSE